MNQILVNQKVIVTPEFRRKKKFYKFNFLLSVCLVCVLVLAYIYMEYDRNRSEQVSQEILMSLQETDDIQEENNNTSDNTTISVENDILYVTLLASHPDETTEVDITHLIQNNIETRQQENPTIIESIAEDGTKYYTEAILKIDSIGIEYPVLSDTSDELLKISLNKLWGPNPNDIGNYVIIGHNYKSGKMFGKLTLVDKGDTFTLSDLSGKTITYKVYDKYIIEPTDVKCTSQLTKGKREVTLITCTNYGKQRLVVKAMEV